MASHSGSREMLNPNEEKIRLSHYWNTFVKVTYFVNSNFSTSVKIKNVLNKKILTPSTSTNLTEGVINRGREFFVNLNYKF